MKNGSKKSLFDQLVLVLIVGLVARTIMLIDNQFDEVKGAIASLAQAFKDHEKDEAREIKKLWSGLYKRQMGAEARSGSDVK